MSNPYTDPRPTWDAVMSPLAESSLWPYIRQVAGDLLEAQMRDHYGADHGFGISSSDINHTVFGTAQWVYVDPDTPSGDRSYVSKVLRTLVNELAGYRSPCHNVLHNELTCTHLPWADWCWSCRDSYPQPVDKENPQA